MKKYIKILPALIASGVLLTGCTGIVMPAISPDVSSDTEVSGVSPDGQRTDTVQAAPEEPTESFETAGVMSVEASEGTSVVLLDLDGTPIDMENTPYTNDYENYYIFDGFAWFAEPTGKAIVTVDGVEPDPVEYTQPEFKRRKVGETFDGLTLRSAQTEIDIYDGESYFNGCCAEFDGTTQITGYAFIQQETDYLMPKDEIFFMPEEGGCTLPVIYYSNCWSLQSPMFYNGIGWGNEYSRQFDLGSVSDYSGKDWLGLLPADGTPVRITATVSNVFMSHYGDSHMSGDGKLTCTIDDLSLAQ